MPILGDSLEIEGGEFSLELVFESEVEFEWVVRFSMAKDGFGFARVMVAVVVEEDDFAADFGLQAAGGLDFGEEEAPGKESAGLLAETDDGGGCHTVGAACSLPIMVWMAALNNMQAAQPMKLYQR
jgi:hypothetical protein